MQNVYRKPNLCNWYCTHECAIGKETNMPEIKEKTISEKRIKSEQSLRKLIARHMRKEIMHYTKPSIDMIKKILDDCYADDIVKTDLVKAFYSASDVLRGSDDDELLVEKMWICCFKFNAL